jgi:hypothetical protein
LREGWVDYFTPQLYWRVEGPQSYPKLLGWWRDENVKGRHLWPGNGAHNVRRGPDVEPARNAWVAEELLDQIEITRDLIEQPGNVHFSMKCLIDNRDGLTDKLKRGVYAKPALIPEVNWLGGEAPGEPVVRAQRNSAGVAVELKAGRGAEPWVWVVRLPDGDKWTTEILPGREKRKVLSLDDGAKPREVFVSAVSRLGREGPVVQAEIKGGK